MAAALAAGHDIELPASLALWRMAGGRPGGVAPRADAQPWHVLGRALEAGLPAEVRRLGAHYTPPETAASVVASALPGGTEPGAVVDPACGGGALLLEAANRLVELGARRTTVARDLLWGADVDPLAVAVTEAAIALWSGGVAPTAGHVATADALTRERAHLWPTAPAAGFVAVVGNPPFQGQLANETMRDAEQRRALRLRFGNAAGGYVDTATVFLLAAVGLAAPGARVAMVQPQSIAGASHGAAARSTIGARATLLDVVVLPPSTFAAAVDVCVVVLEVGPPMVEDTMWTVRLAMARGVPTVELGAGPTIGSIAEAIAGFRQHYYGLVGHVHDAPIARTSDRWHRLVTSGAIDIGRTTWGRTATRFDKQTWQHPVVDVEGAAAADGRVADWIERLSRPKVVVASQTRVTEAFADHTGMCIPGVPCIALIPADPADVDRIAAAVCAPPVAAWAARRASGTGMSRDSIRLSAPLLVEVPLPLDRAAWEEAAELLAAGDLPAFGRRACEMYRLPPDTTEHVLTWWDVARTRR